MMNVEHRDPAHGANFAIAVAFHFGLGAVWLVALVAAVLEMAGSGFAALWGFAAAGLWFFALRRMGRDRSDPGRVWSHSLVWWLQSFVAPAAAAYEVAREFQGYERGAGTASVQKKTTPVGDVEARLHAYERKLKALEWELAELRASVAGASPASAPEPPPAPEEPVQVPAEAPAPSPVPPRPVAAPAGGRGGTWNRELNLADLFGARALAWTGGIVTLLGIVLLFALAVNRGWIGPLERVEIGAGVSALVFLAGVWLRRRFGETYSALAAVGAGIAGGYATLTFAAAVYELLSGPEALVVAGAIAVVGLATSLLWSAEIVAGIGLGGAMAVPVAVIFQEGELSVLGTSFALVMLAAAGAVGVRKRWETLIWVSALVTLPQIASVVAQAAHGSPRVAALAAAYWLVYLGVAVAEQLRSRARTLGTLPATFSTLAAAVAGGSVLRLFDGSTEGAAFFVVAAVYGVLAAGFFPRSRSRDLASLLAAFAFAFVAVGAADLLSGQTLAVAWAAEASILAWLALRVREPRFQLFALAYLALAVGHVFAFDAPLRTLFVANARPAHGALAAVAAAIGAGIVAWHARGLGEQRLVRSFTGWLASGLLAYAASLGILQLARPFDRDVAVAFDWGHAGVSAFLAAGAACVLYAGIRRRSLELQIGAAVWFGVAIVKLALYDVPSLTRDPRGWAALGVGASLLAASLAHQLLDDALETPRPFALTGVSVSAVLAFFGVVTLVRDTQLEGAALVGLAALFGLLAAALVGRARERDLRTLLWSTALAIGAAGTAELFDGTWLVLAWAVAAAALAWLADGTGERRLLVGSAAYAGMALVHTLAFEATVGDFFSAGGDPGPGVPPVALVAAAAAVLARFSRPTGELEANLRHAALWVSVAAAVYAGSLGILDLFQSIGTSGRQNDFQHGQTAVSAFWAVLGLAALYTGLRRHSRTLRLAGFALFGVSLGKIFLFDLPALSSVTRAFSFLAVGAVLLLGGFFYQRLSAERDGRRSLG